MTMRSSAARTIAGGTRPFLYTNAGLFQTNPRSRRNAPRPADYVLRHGYIQGHYHRGASQLYVNRGFGTAGPPARVGAPPEVSRIVLTSV